jgi:hypothetical protein
MLTMGDVSGRLSNILFSINASPVGPRALILYFSADKSFSFIGIGASVEPSCGGTVGTRWKMDRLCAS